jgi:hypothetical protein
MSKLDLCLSGLTLVDRVIYATGGACMPTHQSPKKRQLDDVACVYPNAAGLDIGSAEIVVAVPPDRDPAPVRVFLTVTPDLHALAAWLVACHDRGASDRGSGYVEKGHCDRFSVHPMSMQHTYQARVTLMTS